MNEIFYKDECDELWHVTLRPFIDKLVEINKRNDFSLFEKRSQKDNDRVTELERLEQEIIDEFNAAHPAAAMS